MATEVGPGSATTDTRPAAPAAVRWGAWAGIAYVLAWLIGLFLAPSAPDPFGSAVTINAYFSAHRPAAMIQSVFIHGLAGVALLGLTAALWSYLAARDTAGPRRVMLAAGVLAAAVSFLQVAFMIAIYVHVGQQGSAAGTRTVFNAINQADTIKLLLLAVFVGAASWAASRNGALPRWVAWLGAVTVVFLVAGGLAFLVNSGVLNLALDVSLPLLLLWAAAASISMIWRGPAGLRCHARRGGEQSLLRASPGQAVNEDRLIPAGDHHVRLYEEGAGSPAVVIIAGAGDCADSWVPIRHRLAAVHRVISYDRAAIGGSDQAAPATAERYLAELEAVIDAASPQHPVILAGHSLGGLIARLYQHARSGRVSGLVLLDSTPEAVADDRGVQVGFVASSLAAWLLKLFTPLGFTRLLLRWQRMPLYPEQSRYQAAVPPPEYDQWMTMVCASFAGGAGAEPRSVIPTAAQAKRLLAGHTIPVPLAVIASSAFGDKWVSWQREIATLSATGSFTFTGTRSHNIHLRHAAAVTTAVGEIASPAGTNSGLSLDERLRDGGYERFRSGNRRLRGVPGDRVAR